MPQKTRCEECGTVLVLDTYDADGVLVGNECPKCGYYVTRYVKGQEPR